MAPSQIRPENVAKRADELIALGQKATAFVTIHDFLQTKRGRNTPIALLEPIMLKFIELTVDLRRGKTAKEGLYSYRNIAQNTSVETIEVILMQYLHLATLKVQEAQSKSQQLILDSATDLDAVTSPEYIIMANVSSESSQDRTDRTILTPWLAFLWEAYRTVLEILRNNARLEVMYQKVADSAFRFCLTYNRKPEFKRLCDLIRNHLQNASKFANMPHSISLSDPDTLQRHLDIRFSQLNASVQLELWNEAFKSLEDIHQLLSVGKKTPKPQILQTYYERMIQIFLKSSNYLYHAAAWNRVASIKFAGRSQEEEKRMANFVTLSALAIPVIASGKYIGGFSSLDNQKMKESRFSALVGLQNPPTRSALLQQVIIKGFLARARPEIAQIFNILELRFHPLSICKTIRPLLQFLAKDEDLAIYIKPLQQVILTRLFQQLTQVYETTSLNFLLNLIEFDEPYAIKVADVERFIMNGNHEGELNIRIDHATNTLYLINDAFRKEKQMDDTNIRLQPTTAEIVQTRLAKIGNIFFSIASRVDPNFSQNMYAARERARQAAIKEAESEHREVLDRKVLIEKRRETVEQEAARAELERANKAAAQKQMEHEAEVKRLQEEFKRRELERIRREQNAIRQEEARKLAEDLKAKGGLKVDVDNLEDLDATKLRALHIQQLERESHNMSEKMKATAKKLDYLERALRREEIKSLEKDAQEQLERDREAFAKSQELALSFSEKKHLEALEMKERFAAIVPDYSQFRDQFYKSRRAAHDAKVQNARKALEQAKKKRILESQNQKIAEIKRAREEENRKRKEERVRLKAEEKAKLAAETRRMQLEELKKAHEAEKAHLDEQARKQRARELEVEKKLMEKRKTLASGHSLSMARTASTSNNKQREEKTQGVYRPTRFEKIKDENIDSNFKSDVYQPKKWTGHRKTAHT